MEPVVRLLGRTQPEFEILDRDVGDGGKPWAFIEWVYPHLTEGIDLIEYAGRWDYGEKSIAKMGDRSVIGRWLNSGEESMVEMVDAVFFIECSRVVTHELVRHRIASYQQESQRFVRYDDEEPDELFYLPDDITEEQAEIFRKAYAADKETYLALKAAGIKNQIARYILPNGTRTRIITKMNLREWRHVLRLRAHSSAQPEFQIIAKKILEILYEKYPEVFEDVKASIENQVRAAR